MVTGDLIDLVGPVYEELFAPGDGLAHKESTTTHE